MKLPSSGHLFSCFIALGLVSGLSGCGPKASTADDEIRSVKKEQKDYLHWSKGLKALAQPNAPAAAVPKPAGTIDPGHLPHPDAIKASLLRRLPSDLKLVKCEAISVEKTDEGGMTATYAVETKAKSAFLLVPVIDAAPGAKASTNRKRLTKNLVLALDLPPGKTYALDQAKKIAAEQEAITFSWTVREAKLDGNIWKVLDAEPVAYQRSAKLEARYLQEVGAGQGRVIRSEEELSLAQAHATSELTTFDTRMKEIEEKVAEYRKVASTGVPPPPVDKGGGAGSGTPTKTALGAGAGAGAGAVVGGITGFAIGRSDENRELERKRAARAAAQRQANAVVAKYENELVAVYEQELTTKAQAHIATLQSPK